MKAHQRFLVTMLCVLVACMSWSTVAYADDPPAIPTAAQMLEDPTVSAAIAQAWTDSQADDKDNRHEEGGWIVQNTETGALSVHRWPKGTGSSITPSARPQIPCHRVVGHFHTHPNPPEDEDGTKWVQGASTSDTNFANNTGLPGIIRNAAGTETYGPATADTEKNPHTPFPDRELTTDSTTGGSVTTPGEGTFTYEHGTEVDLVAEADSGYRFVGWTGDVETMGNTEDAGTSIIMNDDYAITANFAFGTLVVGVPDTNQPPTQTLSSTVFTSNYCAPMAMVNVVQYWDLVIGHPNAIGVTAGLAPETAAEYMGYFMDTNNTGSLDRGNPGHVGTYAKDIEPGTWEFVRWDAENDFPSMPDPESPLLPAGKNGYDWAVLTAYHIELGEGAIGLYTHEIDAGRPVVVCFRYWNPEYLGMEAFDPETGETIHAFAWGDETTGSADPEEEWNHVDGDECVGHAVTGVGYVLDWDPEGSGTPADYVIVHDNWSSTPSYIAIPFENWNSIHAVDPSTEPEY